MTPFEICANRMIFIFLYNNLTITDYLWLDEIHLKGVKTIDETKYVRFVQKV